MSNSETETETETVYVIKRKGQREEVSFDKVSRRIKTLSTGLNVRSLYYCAKGLYKDLSRC